MKSHTGFTRFCLGLGSGVFCLQCNYSAPGESQPSAMALRAQGSSPACRPETHLLILDEDAIGPGRLPNRFTEKDVNADSAFIGNRYTLEYFSQNIGNEITLPAGEVGDEGWFAPTSVRYSWKSAGPDIGDGLRNYVEAGPGLGKPDAKGRKETLLENVPQLAPLRAMGLARLEGKSVCGVVLQGDVRMNYATRSGNVQGPNLGKVAFQVLSTQNDAGNSANALPTVKIRILEANAVCGDPLVAFATAPLSNSKSEPRDIARPSCSVQENVINETWDIFDTSLWVGDGDQVVENGRFFAREGANSAAADYITPCPVTIESTTAVRFSNRLQLTSPSQNNFAESGALFMVNADNDGSFRNFVFVNVGYTMAPSKVFVELFGSNNGVEFDQFEETSLNYSPSQLFAVDLWIRNNAYQVGVAGEMIDTVALSSKLPSVSLFEVGVQQNAGGLKGLVDLTSIDKLCPKVNTHQCRKKSSFKGKRWHKRVSEKCRTRNDYIRLAREKMKRCAKPSAGIRCLAKMKERPETI